MDGLEYLQLEHAYIESYLEHGYGEYRAGLDPSSEAFRSVFDDLSVSAE